MLAPLVLIAFGAILAVVGGLWVRDRERELRQELKAELLRKLEREQSHLSALLYELRRSSRSVRVSRVDAVLRQLERDGLVESHWEDDLDGRPRRVYAAVARVSNAAAELEPVPVGKHG